MILVYSERVIMVDIDDTLVMHGDEGGPRVDVVDPVDGRSLLNLRVNAPMVRLVNEEIARGSQIVFWSRGGYAWAYSVVMALNFDERGHEFIIMTKPFAYFDDSDVSTWMKDRVYILPDTPYKK